MWQCHSFPITPITDGFPSQKASSKGLWWFCCCWHTPQAVEQTAQLPLIWDIISLIWRRCKCYNIYCFHTMSCKTHWSESIRLMFQIYLSEMCSITIMSNRLLACTLTFLQLIWKSQSVEFIYVTPIFKLIVFTACRRLKSTNHYPEHLPTPPWPPKVTVMVLNY